jgi:hypothetical protein
MSPEEVARRWLRLSRWSLVLKPEPTAEQIKEELAKPAGWRNCDGGSAVSVGT